MPTTVTTTRIGNIHLAQLRSVDRTVGALSITDVFVAGLASTPAGEGDSLSGIREFVVGTGGKNTQRCFSSPRPNSEIRQADTYGVLRLTLHPTSYEWAFAPEECKTFTESDTCH
jgi:hypothetical protein